MWEASLYFTHSLCPLNTLDLLTYEEKKVKMEFKKIGGGYELQRYVG